MPHFSHCDFKKLKIKFHFPAKSKQYGALCLSHNIISMSVAVRCQNMKEFKAFQHWNIQVTLQMYTLTGSYS